jgi:hypothetical protein
VLRDDAEVVVDRLVDTDDAGRLDGDVDVVVADLLGAEL